MRSAHDHDGARREIDGEGRVDVGLAQGADAEG